MVGEIPSQSAGEHDDFEVVDRILASELDDGPEGQPSDKRRMLDGSYGIDGWMVSEVEPNGQLEEGFAVNGLKTSILVVRATTRGMARYLAQQQTASDDERVLIGQSA